MGFGGLVPRKRRPRTLGPRACVGESGCVTEELAEGLAEAPEVARSHDAARSKPFDDLSEPTHVVDDGGNARPERLKKCPRLVELRPVGEDGDGRLRERLLELARAEVPEPPLDPSPTPRTEVVERDPRVAGDDEPRVRDRQHRLDCVREALVRPDHARREHRSAVVCASRVAAEHGMRDHVQPLGRDAECSECLAPALGVHDDRVEASEQPQPETPATPGAARQKIVRGEDERARRAEECHVELGRGEPLQVEDVGLSSQQTAHRDRVFHEPRGDPGGAVLDPRGASIEALLEPVAVRGRPPTEPEGCRDELDLGACAGERRSQLVVVRRRERRWIGEDDVHVRTVETRLELLVRSWNVFHGRTNPPGRRGYLREMVELATADRPDVLCLQEVPVWALLRLGEWSGGMTSVPAVTRLPVWPAPLTGWLTRWHEAFFRSALAGQANAILVAGKHRVDDRGRDRVSETRREPRLVSAVRLDGVVVANLHATNDFARPEVPLAELERARAFAERHARDGDAIVLAGDFNVREPALDGYSAPGRGIDHVLVRGAEVSPLHVWPREARLHNGAVLSDHAPVELRVRLRGSR